MRKTEMRVTAHIWTARVMPLLLATAIGYATYVLVAILCVNHLLAKDHARWTSISILASYFLLFILMITSFFRLTFITYFDPPFIPLGVNRCNDKQDNTGAGAYCNDKEDIDSSGLELFYTKNTFIADSTGKPRWCSPCGNWKPDRTHHCQSSGRCIRKMDHFCPWVGGPVGENNFKFFIQFTGYSALYCIHLLVVMTTYVFGMQKSQGDDFEYQFLIVIAITGFFLIFTGSMALNSVQLAMKNLTQVERLAIKKKKHFLAVSVPPWQDLNSLNLSAKLSHNHFYIIYPLRAKDEHLELRRYTPCPPSSTHLRHHRNQFNAPIENSSESNHMNIGLEKISTNVLASSKSEEQLLTNADSNELFAQQHNWSKNQTEIQKILISSKGLDGTNSIYESGFQYDEEASRIFVIIQTNEGENPWDLGTRLENWKTVMGESIFEWILPVRRSPCCNHESSESQFPLGPVANQIRSRLGFLPLELAQNHQS